LFFLKIILTICGPVWILGFFSVSVQNVIGLLIYWVYRLLSVIYKY
jgi:hypothetical protein